MISSDIHLDRRIAALEADLQNVKGDLALVSWLYAEMIFHFKKAIVEQALRDPMLRNQLVEQLAARA